MLSMGFQAVDWQASTDLHKLYLQRKKKKDSIKNDNLY